MLNSTPTIITIFSMMSWSSSESKLDILSEDKKVRGIIDLEVITSETLYIFELKKDKSVDSALKQIDDRGYADGYKYQGLKIVKVGIKIDSKKRKLSAAIEKILVFCVENRNNLLTLLPEQNTLWS